MNENLNLVEILKNCPEGTKLYSTIYGDVELGEVRLNDNAYPIEIKIGEGSDMICDTTNDGRLLDEFPGECTLFPSKEQRDWSKFNVKKHRFDPKTLQPYDKVLAKFMEEDDWRCTFFSHIRRNAVYKYATMDCSYRYCIPYNDDTKHLLGTNDEAPEFYRYWED